MLYGIPHKYHKKFKYKTAISTWVVDKYLNKKWDLFGLKRIVGQRVQAYNVQETML